MTDTTKIEYAVLEDECRRLNAGKNYNEVFLKQIAEDIKALNEKVDDLMLVVEDLVNDTPQGLNDVEHLYQVI